MKADRPRVLLIGPRRSDEGVGGAVVSFEQLVDGLTDSHEIEIEVLDTQRRPGSGRFVGSAASFARVVTGALVRTRRCDAVLFNASSGAVMSVGPVLWMIARLFGKPFLTRVFGGAFDLFYERAPAHLRAVCTRTVLTRGTIILQTRRLCERFAHLPNVRWLPTTRDIEGSPRRGEPCTSFVFLSQLKPEKGLDEALAASDRLPEGSVLDFYGPLVGRSTRIFEGHPRARYMGEVEPRDVPAILHAHDALVFPTWYEGEGMPGVVIEAMQCALPVIGTRWRALGELVEHEKNGLLIEPRAVDELAAAMQRLLDEPELYVRLSEGALARGQEFKSAPWCTQLTGWILDTLRPPGAPSLSSAGQTT